MQRALLRRSANLPMKLMPIRRSLTVGLCLPLSVAAFSLTPQSLGSLGFSTSTELKMSDKMDQSFPTWRFDTPCTSMEWNSPVNAELSLAEDTGDYSADLVVVGVVAPSKDEDADEDEDAPVVLSGAAEKVDQILGGAVKDLLEENAESFKNGATLGGMSPVLRSLSDGKTTKYVFVGLGCPPKDDDESPHSTAGVSLGKAISKLCNGQKKTASVQIVLPEEMCGADSFAKDFSTAFYQSLYADNRYRTGKKIKKVAEDLKKVCILCEGAVPAGADDSIAQGKQLATGIFLTKDIVNAPHNVLNSLSLADTARRIADDSDGCITCEILDKEACEERSMGAYLGVARGSETPPQFIHLTYNPPSGGIKKKVGVIGKGLLFDTGGYNIKTAMMELMKFDCGGAAAVLGAARAIGALQPEGVEAHFVVAACENMINEKAMVPSDILTASNGKTIEVMNTDAEGRLTLADALVFCDKEIECESIIELSTLTGACMISLGKEICGLWTENDDLAKELKECSKVTGDKSWRMPMAKEYNEQLESKFADLKNIGTRYGGSITAALFLQNFVEGKKPFAHLDIAGPVWSDSDGATGFGAKLVTEWVTRQGQENTDS